MAAVEATSLKMEPRHVKVDEGSCQAQNWRTVITIIKVQRIWTTGPILIEVVLTTRLKIEVSKLIWSFEEFSQVHSPKITSIWIIGTILMTNVKLQD